MMKRYAVTIEIETYATNREHALSQSLDVLANTEDNLATHCNRIVGIIHETDENGTPLMTRQPKRIVISRGTR
jgi:hypothetical protein